jgi:hypothetical protein
MGVDRQVNASFAWGSPRIQRHRFSGSFHETLPPLDESHVRQWLRELYPAQFNPTMDLNTNEDASLELEEVRALFRAILAGHISRQWFSNHEQMFSPPVMESLGLLLRNQRDRFMMSYYGDVFLEYPQDEPTNRFIWRQVFQHVAYDNLDTRSELWRVDFNAQLFINQPMLEQVIEIDHIINSLIGSLSATEQPPLTSTYNTADPTTYDTLLPAYGPRRYPVVLPTNHEPYPSMAQRYASRKRTTTTYKQ